MIGILRKINYIFNKKQKLQLVVLFFIIMIGTAFELMGVTMILPIINAVLAPEEILNNEYSRMIYEMMNFQNSLQYISFLAWVLIAVYIVKNIYIVWMNWIQYRFLFNNQRRMGYRLLSSYMSKPYLFHVSQNSTTLLRNITQDVTQFFACVEAALQLLTEISVCLVLGIILLLTDWVTTLVVAVFLVGTMAILMSISKKKVEYYGQLNRVYARDNSRWILQSLGGIKETIILERKNFFIRQFDKVSKNLMDSRRKYQFVASLPRSVMEVTCICGLLLVVIFKINSGGNLESFIPTLSLFGVAAFRLLPSFTKMSRSITSINYSRSSVNALYEDLKEAEEGLRREEEQTLEIRPMDYKKCIEVKNVSFHYPNVDKNVLENVSIKIEKNKSIGLIGPSGAGKTTLVDIILGVLEPQKGEILIDGVKITDNMRGWHKKIGYIPQTIFLTDDTLRNNIAFGVRPGKVKEDEVWRAIEEAQLKEFVDQLEDGIETVVGERGVRLSGGQRQRIGIARALYNNPEILVLDEATSSLDHETETAVMEAVEKLSGSKTLLIIAHRLTTIRNCDYIFEVKDQTAYQLSGEEWSRRLSNLGDYQKEEGDNDRDNG